MALRLNTSEKNEIMPRRKARAEKPRLAQMLLRSGSLAGVESSLPSVLGLTRFSFSFGVIRAETLITDRPTYVPLNRRGGAWTGREGVFLWCGW